MSKPASPLDHQLNPISGYSTGFDNLEKTAAIDAAVTVQAPAGRCVHVDPTNETFKLGCPATTAAKVFMPLFLFRSSDDFDVQNDGGIDGAVGDAVRGWAAANPAGNVVALPATGGYELETTEYNTGSTYTANDALTTDTGSDQTSATAGLLDKGNPASTKTVGIVSAAPSKNEMLFKNTLRFWPVVLG